MELFSHDDVVSALKASLAVACQTDQPRRLMELAWQLRQRDPRHAVELVEQAQALLVANDGMVEAERRYLGARGTLIRAETAWLFGDLDLALQTATQAAEEFIAQGAHAAWGDAQWTAATVWHERGEYERRDEALRLAEAAYGRAEDESRLAIVRVKLQYESLFRKSPSGQPPQPEAVEQNDSIMVLAWTHAARALAKSFEGNPSDAVKSWIRAYEAAQQSGQIRQSIVFAANVGNEFQSLNDLDLALEWVERGLELARNAGWPYLIGMAWKQMASIMGALKRPVEATVFLRDAIRIMEPFGSSLSYLGACVELAIHMLNCKEDAAHTLALLEKCETLAVRLDAAELLFDTRRLQPAALARLGRFNDAAEKIDWALTLAREQGHAEWQLRAMRVLADLYLHEAMPRPAGMPSKRARLICLDDTLAVARGIEDYIVPPDLLEEVAAEHARFDDPNGAYLLALEAGQAREKRQIKEAGNRVIAMQIRHETERLRAEADYHRQLGRIQAQRADVLQQSVATLEELGSIGRDITSNLDSDSLLVALNRHAQRLLDCTSFAIHRFNARLSSLDMVFGIEAGQPLGIHSIAFQDPTSYTARCARDRKDLVIEDAPEVANSVPGAIEGVSLMYAPMLAGDHLLGVMSIQSPQARAYGERERAVFRTLCAYGAIAISNAESMAALRTAEGRLLQQNIELEQMAVTDRLTGLYNRLHLDRQLQGGLETAQRYGRAFSLIILDLDHFKQVNDTYGHLAGDKVLVAVAGLLMNNHRKSDVVGRWGGEEFLVICAETCVAGGLAMAEHLRSAVAQFNFPHVGHRTASFGVATYRAGDTILSMTSRADKGLYFAKQSGRNKVVAF